MRIKVDDKWIDVGEQYREKKPKIKNCIVCKLWTDKQSGLCKICEKEIESKYDLLQLS